MNLAAYWMRRLIVLVLLLAACAFVWSRREQIESSVEGGLAPVKPDKPTFIERERQSYRAEED